MVLLVAVVVVAVVLVPVLVPALPSPPTALPPPPWHGWGGIAPESSFRLIEPAHRQHASPTLLALRWGGGGT